MSKIKEIIADYIADIKKHPIRLTIGILVAIALYVMSTIFLFSGFNKTFIIYSFLCIAIGCFISLPRIKVWYFNAVLILIYLLIIPKKMFERIELPVHTMEKTMQGATLANICIILFVFLICLLIFQRVRFALGIGSILLLICFLANCVVIQFRGTAISYNDLLAIKTAMQVAEGYKFTMTYEIWYSILYFLSFIFCGFWIDIPIKGIKYHIAITSVAVVGIISCIYFISGSDYLERHELRSCYWNMADNQKLNGFLLSFVINILEKDIEMPEGYSKERISEIIKYSESNYVDNINDIKNPNIIIIMNESWSDLSVLGELETSEDCFSFVNSMNKNTIKGNLHVGILGGLTANTEYEVLTGDSVNFMPPGMVPYQIYVDHDMSALPSVLKEQGYQTLAMHAGDANAWNRKSVYMHFGFDDFIDANEFQTEWLYERTFISDVCNYNEIIYQFENRDKSKPWFLFNVTIQNHGAYYGGIDMPITIESIGGNEPEGYLKDAETYINLMNISDEAFEELIEYFSNVSEPTIICMFGDHQPYLGENFYNSIYSDSNLTEEEKNARKYITPYLIWSNYDMDAKEYGDISANYLGAVVLECAGVELPPYYKMLLNLNKKYPIISSYTINDIQNEPLIQDYKIMQYDHLVAE